MARDEQLLVAMAVKTNAASQFTRGTETFAHFISMLKAGLARLLFVSLFLGTLVGGAWFLSSIEWAHGDLLSYCRSWLHKKPDLEEWQIFFGGRTLHYLLVVQGGLRIATSFMLVAITGALLMLRHGGQIMSDRKERGMFLRKVSHRSLIPRFVWGFVAAIAVVTTYQAFQLGELVHHLPDYFYASLLLSWPGLTDFVSPDGRPLAWFSGPQGDGFYAISAIHSLLLDMFRLPVRDLLIGFVWKVLPAVVFFFFLIRFVETIRDYSGYTLAGIPIKQETKHILILGSTGAGKSVAMQGLMDQVRAAGRRAIVYDISGEYISLYYRPGKDIILNPLDLRTAFWTPWADAKATEDFAAIAKAIFPQGEGGKDPFWNNAGSVMMACCAEVLGARGIKSNKELHRTLTQMPIEELRELLAGTSAANFLGEDAGPMPSNVRAIMASKLEPWLLLPDPPKGAKHFSIKEFVRNMDDDAWLFLSTNESHAEVLKPILSHWADVASAEALELPHTNTSKLWFFLDELASLKKLPALPGLLERGRKHGLAVVIGLQAMPQLKAAYGAEAAKALASQPQTWLVLRTKEPDTAKWLQEALGTAEVEEVQESLSMGARAQRDGVSLQRRKVQRPIALASEIASLPDLHGYLTVPGSPEVMLVQYKYTPRMPVAPPFYSRKQVALEA